MHTERFKRTRFVGLLSAGVGVLLCILAVYGGSVHGQSATGISQASAGQSQKVQSTDAAATGESDADSPADGDDGPSPGNFLGSTYVPSILGADQPSGVLAAAPPPPKPIPADAGGDQTRQEINNETANLLALAYALKVEVDKTSKDELSISVVRKAGQIEQMAHKVRDEMRPALSRN